ncbi:MAG: outer membrane lipoprotein-sorting protein [Halieaceae bacterium]|jgi:outer membrane lipoprotein-sorting protein|nr:outer membrane lipoprotein-sorting protein [Halieaceae bacterium]
MFEHSRRVFTGMMALLMARSIPNEGVARPTPRAPGRAALIALALATAGLLLPKQVFAEDLPVDGLDVARRIDERAEGDASRRVVDIVLTDRRGKTRERSALVLKSRDDGSRSTRFTYLAPKSVKDVTFLSRDDLASEGGDERWLYLPATRKVRRIPASDRGDYFLGTDFTYEDIQSEFKLSLRDYDFTLDSSRRSEDGTIYVLSATPKTEAIARELGYGGLSAEVDGNSWLFRRAEFFDLQGDPLKTVTVHAAEAIDGIWCATDVEVVNHQTGHETRFLYREVAYPPAFPEQVFSASSLSRGLPQEYLP